MSSTYFFIIFYTKVFKSHKQGREINSKLLHQWFWIVINFSENSNVAPVLICFSFLLSDFVFIHCYQATHLSSFFVLYTHNIKKVNMLASLKLWGGSKEKWSLRTIIHRSNIDWKIQKFKVCLRDIFLFTFF